MPRDETNAKSFNSTQIQLFLSDEDNNKSGPTSSSSESVVASTRHPFAFVVAAEMVFHS